MSTFSESIPASVRKPLYSGYGVVGLIIGATQVAYVATETGQPTWLTAALAVYGFIGTYLGFTAAGNTPTRVVRVSPGAEITEEDFDTADGHEDRELTTGDPAAVGSDPTPER